MGIENCRACPIGEKIDLYMKAARDPELSMALMLRQKLDPKGMTQKMIQDHFLNTARTLLIGGCQSRLLCGRNHG